MKVIMSTLFITTMLCYSSLSYAEWSYSHVPGLNKWVVTDGEKSIQFKTKKGAKKAARVLNKNEKKVEKKEEGFWDDGSEHCANPLNEC